MVNFATSITAIQASAFLYKAEELLFDLVDNAVYPPIGVRLTHKKEEFSK